MIGVQRKIELREGVLDNLFDLFALREEASGNARDLTPVPIEQSFERAFVPCCGSGNQCIICRFNRRIHEDQSPVCSVIPASRNCGTNE